MLDTNVVSHALRNPHGSAATRFLTYKPGELCISVIVQAELRFGAAKIGSQRLMQQLDGAARLYDVLPLSVEVVDYYSNVRVALERAGTPIGANDLFIAAHALSLDVPLVTANVGEFSACQICGWRTGSIDLTRRAA